MKHSLLLPICLISLLATELPSQDDQELILDNRNRVTTRARVRSAATPTPTPVPQHDVAPTPRPEDIIVAVVNARALTKAELDVRVGSRYDEVRKRVQSQIGGVLKTVDAEFSNFLLDLDADTDEVLEEQRQAIETAMALEEEQAMQDWVSHALLSDEARRQGIIVTESEFRQRIADAERQSELDSKTIDETLAELRLSRADYEKSVYDALLIEKLLIRFIDLNYTQEQFKAAYDLAPAMFFEPPKYSIAHYVIALTGSETTREINDRKALAEKVRAALRTGADPAQLFQQAEFNRPDLAMGGILPGFMTLDEPTLPPVVQVRGRQLKPGETSAVLLNQSRDGTRIVTNSIHVIKMLDVIPESGRDFESAMPAIRRSMMEIGRTRLLERLREAGTHRIITNLGGIPPHRLPTPERIRQSEANAQPISLVLPRSGT